MRIALASLLAILLHYLPAEEASIAITKTSIADGHLTITYTETSTANLECYCIFTLQGRTFKDIKGVTEDSKYGFEPSPKRFPVIHSRPGNHATPYSVTKTISFPVKDTGFSSEVIKIRAMVTFLQSPEGLANDSSPKASVSFGNWHDISEFPQQTKSN